MRQSPIAKRLKQDSQDFAARCYEYRCDWIAVFSAYFDESGFHDSPPIHIVAGFVVKSKSGVRLTKKWNKILAKNEIEVFHGKSYNGGHGEYEGWSRDRYEQFVIELARALNERVEVFISHGVEPNHFKEIRSHFPKVNKSPYQLLFQNCLTGLSNWAMQSPVRQNISVHYEMGNKVLSRAVNQYIIATGKDIDKEHFRISSIEGLTKKEPLIQGAHLYAYQYYKEQETVLQGHNPLSNEALETLIYGKNRVGGRHTLDTVKKDFIRDRLLFS